MHMVTNVEVTLANTFHWCQISFHISFWSQFCEDVKIPDCDILYFVSPPGNEKFSM